MSRKPVSAVVIEQLGDSVLVVVCDDGSTWTLYPFDDAEYEQIASIPGTPAYEESSN